MTPKTLISDDLLIEAARDILSTAIQLNSELGREELLCRVQTALCDLTSGQPDAWLSMAVDTVAEQELGR